MQSGVSFHYWAIQAGLLTPLTFEQREEWGVSFHCWAIQRVQWGVSFHCWGGSGRVVNSLDFWAAWGMAMCNWGVSFHCWAVQAGLLTPLTFEQREEWGVSFHCWAIQRVQWGVSFHYWGGSGRVVNSLDFCPAHRLSPLAAFISGAYFLHNGRRWQWIREFLHCQL